MTPLKADYCLQIFGNFEAMICADGNDDDLQKLVALI